MVVANHKYGDRAPVQIGTQVIDQIVATMTERNYRRLGKPGDRYTWAPLPQKEILVGSPNAPEYDFGGKEVRFTI